MTNSPNKELAEQLVNSVNCFSYDSKEFVDTILRSHRTLQQGVFGLFLQVIEAWSKLDENSSDLRNEYTVKMSKEIMKAMVCGSKVPCI